MFVAAIAVFALVVGGALAPLGGESAVAAEGKDFNPGNIISDEVFYNSKTMTVDQIQAFLNARVPSCRAGYTCLKDYVETTRSQPARSEGCAAYAGQRESAARIIYKVATACGINPQALIVLLEKEQGLVSDSWPTSRQYRSATGYGCPDTADCDANYYGFFNQLYTRPGSSRSTGRTRTASTRPGGTTRSCGTRTPPAAARRSTSRTRRPRASTSTRRTVRTRPR